MSDAGLRSTRPRGRRPGETTTGQDIERAAGELFSQHGYKAVSVRDIASRAGVHHSLVVQRFGSKEHLFVASFRWPFEPEQALAQITASGPDHAARRLVELFVEVWDQEHRRTTILMLLERAAEQEAAAQLLREFVAERVLEPLVVAVSFDVSAAERRRRASLLSVQLMGLAVTRYVLGLEPLASWSARQVANALAPTIDAILSAPAPGRR